MTKLIGGQSMKYIANNLADGEIRNKLKEIQTKMKENREEYCKQSNEVVKLRELYIREVDKLELLNVKMENLQTQFRCYSNLIK